MNIFLFNSILNFHLGLFSLALNVSNLDSPINYSYDGLKPLQQFSYSFEAAKNK